MAARANPKNKRSGNTSKSRKVSVGVLFWILFFIVITGLFLVNRELIRRTLEETQFMERVFHQPAAGGGAETPDPGDDPAEGPSAVSPAAALAVEGEGGAEPETEPDALPEPPPEPQTMPAAPNPDAGPRQNPAGPLRERSLYFTQIDHDGAILRVKAARQLPSSESPMMDALQALLQGPSAEEQRRGVRSLIPPGTRVLSASVRGNTAFISFSDDFQYTEYGVEGYAAQLRQIIWTVTEFSNVKDVQFLIEGRRVDYLGESIWIGSPLNRDSI